MQCMPASSIETQLFLLDQTTVRSDNYTCCFNWVFDACLNPERVERAIQQIIAQSDMLRSIYMPDEGGDGAVMRHVQRSVPFRLGVCDWRADAPDAVCVRVDDLVDDYVSVRFDLMQAPLFQAALVQQPDGRSRLIIAAHHVVFDGASSGVFIKRLLALYAGQGLADCGTDTARHIAHQQAIQTACDTPSFAQYWAQALPSTVSPVAFPGARVSEFDTGFELHRIEQHVSANLWARIGDAAKQMGLSKHALCLSALFCLISGSRAGLGEDGEQVITVPASVRRDGEADLIGMFVSLLPIACKTDLDASFARFGTQVKKRLMGGFWHAHLPHEKIHTAAFATVDARPPSYPVSFDLIQPEAITVDGVTATETPVPNKSTKFSLAVKVEATATGAIAAFEFADKEFCPTLMASFLDQYVAVLDRICATPDAPIRDIVADASAMQRSVAQLLGNMNAEIAGSDLVHVHTQMLRRAQAMPEATAIVDGARRVSYGTLVARGHAIRAGLSAGAQKSGIVAILMPRTVDLFAAMFAVLSAGRTFMPIDPTFPDDRIAYLLNDAAVDCVLTTADLAGRVGPEHVVVDLDTLPDTQEVPDHVPVGPGDIAYVFYTSGSTGDPKGVQVPHRAFSNIVDWARSYFDLCPQDVHTQAASHSFDPSLLEIWAPLTAGATIVITPKEVMIDPVRLGTWMRDHGVTISFLPTPIGEQFLNQCPEFPEILRTLYVAGEALRDFPDSALPFRLVNGYGPTETTILSTATDVTCAQRGTSAMPSIGTAVDQTVCFIADDHGLPLPTGWVGELLIAGTGVASGYLNKPDKTAAAFVDVVIDGTKRRVYRTGDLAYCDADGALHFLGRKDRQVKIRGVRIEPGEIEATLQRDPSVDLAAVTIFDAGDAGKSLVANIQPKAGQPHDEDDLRQLCSQFLPAGYMPDYFRFLAQMPLTTSGKIDRRAIPAFEPPTIQGRDAPQTDAEIRVAALWSCLLKREVLDIDARFGDLGGHSLMVVKLANRFRQELGVDPGYRALLQANTIRAQARLLGGAVADTPATLARLQRQRAVGAGRDIVFVQPFGAQAKYYGPLIDGLDPTHGVSVLSLHPQDDAELDQLAEAAAKALCEWSRLAPVLVGWSSGGALAYRIAMEMAARGAPVEAVALIDTTPDLGHVSMACKLGTFAELIGRSATGAALAHPAGQDRFDDFADVVTALHAALPEAELRDEDVTRLFTRFCGNLDLFAGFAPHALTVPTHFLAAENDQRGFGRRWADLGCAISTVTPMACSHFQFFEPDRLPETLAWLHGFLGADVARVDPIMVCAE